MSGRAGRSSDSALLADTERPRRIVLIGPMGVGKSVVAERVAARLRWRSLDTDVAVVAEAGAGIPAIFAEEGEAGFRQREARALAGALREDDVVVATGGGALCSEAAWALVDGATLVVRLRAGVPTLLLRMGSTAGRPLLAASADPSATLKALIAEREPWYARAHRAIDTDGLTADQVAEAVVAALAPAADEDRATTPEAAPSEAVTRTGLEAGPDRVDVPTRIVAQAPGEAPEVRGARRVKLVQVLLGDRSYPIHVEGGRPWRAARHIAERFGEGAVAVITDGNVGPLYAEPLTRGLRELGMSPRLRVVAPGEGTKTLAEAERLLGWLMDTGHDRRRPVVALGGGVVGDLAGFVASVYLRGVPLVMVPTSLLAMVDSSVGGKTGVNHEAGKNQVGTFHQPTLVHAPLGALTTLPDRELSCGLAEVIKYGVIAEPTLLDTLDRTIGAIEQRDAEAIEPIVTLCCRVKAAIVAKDERESGLREVLNFGHTVGHALEAATGYSELNHGEAVGLGMVIAARVSHRLGLCDRAVEDRIVASLERCRLLTDPAPYRDAPWASAMRHDKKARGSELRFVAVRAIGQVESVMVSTASLLRLAGEAFLG